jgi:hypothetical protein
MTGMLSFATVYEAQDVCSLEEQERRIASRASTEDGTLANRVVRLAIAASIAVGDGWGAKAGHDRGAISRAATSWFLLRVCLGPGMNFSFREPALQPVAGEAKPPRNAFEQITAQAESNDNADRGRRRQPRR